jgi:hypothetical protein
MAETARTELVIQGDREAIQDIEQALSDTAGNTVMVTQVQQQFGDPNLWMLAGKIVITTLTVAGPIILELIKQRRIGYIKWGDLELRDVTVEAAQQVLEAAAEERRTGNR